MKFSTKLISMLLSLLMLFTGLPITAFAATEKTYIKEVRISTAADEATAKQWLTENGYQVLDVNLNQKSGGDAVYMGYITTTNPDEAITDMAVMQMDGGYSFAEYEAMIEERKKDIDAMISSISVAIETARDNYQKGYAGAVKAREILNTFVEDDSGKYLGDLIFVENFDKELINKVFLQGNSDITMIVYNMLALACIEIGEETNWLSKLDKLDVYAEYDPLVYDELSRKMFSSFEEIHDLLEYYEKHCKEIDENPEMLEGMTDEELADYYPEDYGKARFIYVTLKNYKYGNGTLADFFAKDANETDIEELYPLFAAMTPAEREVSLLVGFTAMIAMAQNDTESLNQYFEDFKNEIEFYEFGDKVSVYANVDRSLFDGGVALTNLALRESASTGETAWYSEANIDRDLSIALGCLAGSSLVAAITSAAIVTNSAPARAFRTNMNIANWDGVAYILDILEDRGVEINYTGKRKVSTLKRMLSKEDLAKNIDLFDHAETRLRNDRDFYAKEAFDSQSASTKRMLRIANTVQYVAIGISLLAEAVRIGIKLYNYYHPDFTEIPRIIVDEIATDTKNYYVRYYVTTDQSGEYADLNAWKGQRWNALYTTKDKDAGDPILASGLTAQVKDSSMPTAQSYGVHYFGETGACNVSRYLLKKTSPATYIFFTRDHSLRATASTFSRGTVITFASIGLFGGIVIGSLGVIGAGKLKKKKEESASADTE